MGRSVSGRWVGWSVVCGSVVVGFNKIPKKNLKETDIDNFSIFCGTSIKPSDNHILTGYFD